MFVDELTIKVRAGNGGDGVVRWRREKYIDRGGPSGGDGGKGGDVFMRAVRDVGLLSSYTGSKEFRAEDAMAGAGGNKHGKDGEDLYIDVPVGATVTDMTHKRVYSFTQEGEVQKILVGGRGGFGNTRFKSPINRAPEQCTMGKRGEAGTFSIILSLMVDVGLIGYPNAGKTTMLNALTHTKAKVGSYPFTTIEPHLGDLYGFVLADIPGLIEGASEGKGLGHKFLKHIERTKMLLHCVSLESEDVWKEYQSIRNELERFNPELLKKEEWVLLTKTDLVSPQTSQDAVDVFRTHGITEVHSVSGETKEGIKPLTDILTKHLEERRVIVSA